MSNQQRFRPSTNNVQKPAGRVPVTRPVGRPQEQPTQSFEREEYSNYKEPVQQMQQPRMSMPPNMGFEEEHEEESNYKSKANLFKYIGFGLLGAVVIIGIIFMIMKMSDGGDTQTVDGTAVTQGQQTNPLGNGATTPTGSKTGEVTFDGNPIPVKWPADVTPTRMEIQLDPTSGQPVLMLVGDKSGLGTVIRSYNKSGELSGYWVIVPDAKENTDQAATAPAATEEGTSITEITEPATEGSGE